LRAEEYAFAYMPNLTYLDLRTWTSIPTNWVAEQVFLWSGRGSRDKYVLYNSSLTEQALRSFLEKEGILSDWQYIAE
jgi:hypothetical protein